MAKTRLVAKEKQSQPRKSLDWEAGLVHLEANFQGQTGEVSFTITKSEEKTVCEGASSLD